MTRRRDVRHQGSALYNDLLGYIRRLGDELLSHCRGDGVEKKLLVQICSRMTRQQHHHEKSVENVCKFNIEPCAGAEEKLTGHDFTYQNQKIRHVHR